MIADFVLFLLCSAMAVPVMLSAAVSKHPVACVRLSVSLNIRCQYGIQQHEPSAHKSPRALAAHNDWPSSLHYPVLISVCAPHSGILVLRRARRSQSGTATPPTPLSAPLPSARVKTNPLTPHPPKFRKVKMSEALTVACTAQSRCIADRDASPGPCPPLGQAGITFLSISPPWHPCVSYKRPPVQPLSSCLLKA